jgi:hypothetical protein
MIVRDCPMQYHIIMIIKRTLPTENEIVNEVLYDRSKCYEPEFRKYQYDHLSQ